MSDTIDPSKISLSQGQGSSKGKERMVRDSDETFLIDSEPLGPLKFDFSPDTQPLKGKESMLQDSDTSVLLESEPPERVGVDFSSQAQQFHQYPITEPLPWSRAGYPVHLMSSMRQRNPLQPSSQDDQFQPAKHASYSWVRLRMSKSGQPWIEQVFVPADIPADNRDEVPQDVEMREEDPSTGAVEETENTAGQFLTNESPTTIVSPPGEDLPFPIQSTTGLDDTLFPVIWRRVEASNTARGHHPDMPQYRTIMVNTLSAPSPPLQFEIGRHQAYIFPFEHLIVHIYDPARAHPYVAFVPDMSVTDFTGRIDELFSTVTLDYRWLPDGGNWILKRISFMAPSIHAEIRRLRGDGSLYGENFLPHIIVHRS